MVEKLPIKPKARCVHRGLITLTCRTRVFSRDLRIRVGFDASNSKTDRPVHRPAGGEFKGSVRLG
jgi:hypothetical protein